MINDAARFALDGIGNHLLCSACGFILNIPVMRFPCDHVFCKDCVVRDNLCPKCGLEQAGKEDKLLSAMVLSFENLDAALGNPVTASCDSPAHCQDCPGESPIINSSTDNKDNGLMEKREPLATCSFCHFPDQQDNSSLGKMLYIGKRQKRRIFAHEGCTMWAPLVYEDPQQPHGWQNVISEVQRADKLKCNICSGRGAAIGCRIQSCGASYHYPCAVDAPGVHLDEESFLLSCPKHPPQEQEQKQGRSRKASSELSGSNKKIKKLNELYPPSTSKENWSSGSMSWTFFGVKLSAQEEKTVQTFAQLSGSTFAGNMFHEPKVTHMICGSKATSDLAGKSISNLRNIFGCWAVSMDWVKECMAKGFHVAEKGFNVV